MVTTRINVDTPNVSVVGFVYGNRKGNEMPKARLTDPLTSHEAAASVNNVSATQQVILSILREPMDDEALVAKYQVRVRLGSAPRAAASGVRSRRAELFRLGLIEPFGFTRTASNRKAIIWKAL